jgi:predicted Zn finger-like uncharacterized protein
MIIHCSQCGTRYRFAEEKIKSTGTKVRCVRCSNVFLVMPEEKFSPFDEVLEPDASAAESAPPEETPASVEKDEGVATGGLFKGVPSPQKTPVEEQPPALEPEPVTSDEGEAFDFAAAEGSEAESDLDFFDDSGATAAAESDLFVEAADATEKSVEEVHIPEAPETPEAPDDDIFIAAPSLDIASPEPEKSGRSFVGKIFLMLFFLLVILCSGIAGYLFWRGEPFDIPHLMKVFQKSEPAVQKPAEKIHLKDVKSFYVFNQEAGQLFVISGMAVNEFSKARSGISVKGILYDEKGRELRQQTVFCGNPFEKEALVSMPYKTIEENMNNQFGTTFSNLNTLPGKALPFSVVFRNLPEKLVEFSVEVVGSKSVSEK